jgi:hypothetical protein
MTADQYMGKMKGFTTELVAGGCTIDDDELVDLILNDIDEDYNKLVSMVNALKNRTISDLHDLICAFDMRQNMLSSGDKKEFNSSANSASHGHGRRDGYRKRNNYNGRP